MSVGYTKPLASWKCPQSPEKLSYGTFEDARAAADRREPLEKVPLYVYACSTCGRWHLSKKKGDEFVGKVGADGLIMSTGTDKPAPPQRDTRFLAVGPTGNAVAAATKALREHGHPDTLVMGDLLQWIDDDEVTAKHLHVALRTLGWTMTGVRRGAKWHRPGTAPVAMIDEKKHEKKPVEKAEEAPVEQQQTVQVRSVRNPDSRWFTATLNENVKDLTVRQLLDAYAAAGMEMELRLRRADK